MLLDGLVANSFLLSTDKTLQVGAGVQTVTAQTTRISSVEKAAFRPSNKEESLLNRPILTPQLSCQMGMMVKVVVETIHNLRHPAVPLATKCRLCLQLFELSLVTDPQANCLQ